jgi:cytochrome c2
MPRLPISPDDARAIAAVLSDGASVDVELAGDRDRGATRFAQLACGACHEFSGAPVAAPTTRRAERDLAFVLAPDLAHTRQRWTQAQVARWIADPAALRPGTLMPAHALTGTDAADLAAFVMTVELARRSSPQPVDLPLLERRVGFAEVDQAVFRHLCWHCHSRPALANGDGGPGNTGGFGYRARGLDFSSAESAASGSLDDDGARRSVLGRASSVLVRRLRLRQREELGDYSASEPGMPLGFPALTPEQIQLVESWVAQGHPE